MVSFLSRKRTASTRCFFARYWNTSPSILFLSGAGFTNCSAPVESFFSPLRIRSSSLPFWEALWNLVTLRRIGLSVKQIMARVTLGHHWKEYSAREINEYFAYLSPDFRVRVRKMGYGAPNEDLRRTLGSFRAAMLGLGNATGFFAEALEAVISLPVKTTWTRREPRAG